MCVLQVLEMVELAKKVPPLYLLCAVVEGRLLSKTGVETYASYPDKLSLLAQTSATLSQSSQQITRLLNSHQTLLSTNLKTYSDSNSWFCVADYLICYLELAWVLSNVHMSLLLSTKYSAFLNLNKFWCKIRFYIL